MPTECWFFDEPSPCESGQIAWNHIFPRFITTQHIPAGIRPWAMIVRPQAHSQSLLRTICHTAPKFTGKNPPGRSTGHGVFGFGSGVRIASTIPPCHRRSQAEPSPKDQKENRDGQRGRTWQQEHMNLTSKHFPIRDPLPDKGKPVVRRGRKATDQISDLTAGLPEEE